MQSLKLHSLVPNKGLSLSQAQSISNLCNQRANEITGQLNAVNNSEKRLSYEGETYVTVKGVSLPDNVVELLNEKAKLVSCQAFLVENIKAKEDLMFNLRKEKADISSISLPEEPKYFSPVEGSLSNVSEDFGWSQLTPKEYNEYLEAEAYASTIGKFIHQGGKLSVLRAELKTLASVEWTELKVGQKTPIKIIPHHDSKTLLEHHEKLATLHRQYEQRVNYFKSKVKKITDIENDRINRHNKELQINTEKKNNELRLEYQTAMKVVDEKIKTIRAEFEVTRQERISEIATMRIQVDPRFQEVVDIFLKQIVTEED